MNFELCRRVRNDLALVFVLSHLSPVQIFVIYDKILLNIVLVLTQSSPKRLFA
jgi:hypothetical protein